MNPFLTSILLCAAFTSTASASPAGAESDEALLLSQGDRVLVSIPQGLNDDDDDSAPPPAARFKAPAAISKSQLRTLTEKTDDYYFSKHLGVGCAIGATALAVGGMIVTAAFSTRDVTAPDGSTRSEWTTAGDVGIGMVFAAAPVSWVAGAEIVIAIVRGIKLRHYEREVGYQFSLVPVYDPRTRSSGALAQLDF
jgi:hypothetical protein